MPRDVQPIIETLIDLLCQERIYQEIEYPIDKVNVEFQFNFEEPITQAIFNKAIGDFLKLIYGTALRFPRRLSDPEALAEAIHLLSQYSDGEKPDRYEAILTKVISAGLEELIRVLYQMSGIIKEIEQKKYTQWVLNHHFQSLGWEHRCRIAASYKDSIYQFLSPDMKKLRPEELVKSFERLIDIGVRCRNILNPMGFRKGENL